MSIRLIVNADDYGRSANISRGIREAHLNGIVTSSTAMMNMPTVLDDLKAAQKESPTLDLGVHLVLTSGRPLVTGRKTNSLTDGHGDFLKQEELIARSDRIDPEQARIEWHAQIEAFISASKKNPTHLDSHHHVTYFTPGLFQVMLELAKEFNTAIRFALSQTDEGMSGLPSSFMAPMVEAIPRLIKDYRPRTPDVFFASFYDEGATKDGLLHILNHLSDGKTYEIMTHPGHVDEELIASSGYARQREREFSILTDPSIQDELTRLDIKLINFTQL